MTMSKVKTRSHYDAVHQILFNRKFNGMCVFHKRTGKYKFISIEMSSVIMVECFDQFVHEKSNGEKVFKSSTVLTTQNIVKPVLILYMLGK